MKIIKYYFYIFLISGLFVNSFIFSQSRGKIAGNVTDKQTGEPIIGVNVLLVGTNYGAATNINGEYYIIGVPVGIYTLRFSFIGYHTISVENVRVQTDLTTEINIEMESEVIETPEVIISAESKFVQRDITSTRRTYTSEVMTNIAGLESSEDVFRLQAGTVIGGRPQRLELAGGTEIQTRDESVKDIHIRGGRGGEILFLIDGVPVNHPIYGGRSVLDLDISAVEQIELLTGAFSAEYGQAQSGVVNITTKRGGEKFNGGLEYKTDDFGFLNERYNTHYGTFYLGGPEIISKYLLPLINVDIPGDLNFYITLNTNLTNTPYNNHRKRDDFSIFGIKVPGKQDNSSNISSKINWNISKSFSITGSFNGSWKQWSNFSWEWLYNPNNMATYKRDNLNFNLSFNHILSVNSYYNLNLGYLGVKYHGSLDGLSPDRFWVITNDTIYSTVSEPQNDPLTGFRDSKGFETLWRDDNTDTYTAKFDFTSQFHPEHLIKAGFELQFHDISYVDIQDGGTKLSPYGQYIFNNGPYAPPPPGPYKEFGQNRWVFDVKPIVGGLYVQEKFEKEFLVLNIGLRADYFYLGKTVDDKSWRNQWEAATGLNADWDLYKFKLSPRFGISFPILEKTVLFFSYGHFSQLPELQFFYRDPYTGGFTGNPNLDYEQTILYEFGFTHQLTNDWGIDIKTYSRDISKQVGTTQLLAASGLPVSLYDNVGYARARGIELELNKQYSKHYSGKLTYTLQWANGYSSSEFDDYIRSINDFPNPIRERRLEWDVRHQVILQASVSSPKNEEPINLFGLHLPKNWDITILTNLSSGTPYTPYSLDPAVLQVTENTESGPITTSTDIKLIKGFDIFGTELSFTLDIYNLFNANNVNVYYGFNTFTGEPYTYGDVIPLTQQLYSWFEMFRLRNPLAVSPGRYIKFGIRWNF